MTVAAVTTTTPLTPLIGPLGPRTGPLTPRLGPLGRRTGWLIGVRRRFELRRAARVSALVTDQEAEPGWTRKHAENWSAGEVYARPGYRPMPF